MTHIHTLTDNNWQTIVGDAPALIVLTSGSDLRGDFNTQFKKSAQERSDIVFGKANIKENPQLAEHFRAGEKPLLIGTYNGETHIRRTRPWGTDVVLALDLLDDIYTEENPPMTDPTNETTNNAAEHGKPYTVTEATFQQEVIDHSHEQPVLVDFWAEWCGPCRMVAPILDKLAGEFADDIRIAKVDTDANQSLAQAFNIMSIPTIMAFKDGQLVFSQPGAFPEEAFRDLIEQLIDLDVQAAMEEAQTNEEAGNPQA